MFSHLIYYTRKFYKCTFNTIFKDNAAINWTTVQHKRFIYVNFDGSYYCRIVITFTWMNNLNSDYLSAALPLAVDTINLVYLKRGFYKHVPGVTSHPCTQTMLCLHCHSHLTASHSARGKDTVKFKFISLRCIYIGCGRQTTAVSYIWLQLCYTISICNSS
jgi:hypothetical protein